MASPVIEVYQARRYAVDILYLDNHALCAVKPCNMPVQADSSGDQDMLSAMKAYIGAKFSKPGNVYLGLVHRLDRPVGGVMVFARTSKAASRLSADFASHSVDKRYYCVVRGEMKGERELENWLVKDERTGMVSQARPDAPGAKLARLITRPIAHRDNLTLCDVRLFTGRAHQIRVQHMISGFPLWGDARYGDGRPGQQIALWAHSLTFTHPTTKERIEISALPRGGVWETFRSDMDG